MRLLIADKLSSSVVKTLEEAGCELQLDPSLKDDTLTAAIAAFNPEALVVRSTKVQLPQLEAAQSLALIIRAGAGTNTIDLAAASARGIYVANCPGKNAVAVAELAMGHLINADRRISDNVAALRNHQWNKKEFGKARGLHGRTLAVLGAGKIGQEVIQRAQAFGMQIRLWSRSLTPARAEALGAHFAETPLEACTGADALTVHLAANDQTHHIINAELLAALNPGACVINTSRGELLDSDALIKACQERGLRAGLDVFENEPSASDKEFNQPIATVPQVYGTHHIGASTDQASEAVGDEVARIVQTFINSGAVLNCVNLAQNTQATHLLVVRHADRVGVLAGVLDVLKEASLNVQEMENIIFQGGQAACAKIQLNGAPEASTLQHIQDSENILATSLVTL